MPDTYAVKRSKDDLNQLFSASPLQFLHIGTIGAIRQASSSRVCDPAGRVVSKRNWLPAKIGSGAESHDRIHSGAFVPVQEYGFRS